MNWIKSNPFVSALAGITLVICAALFFLASKAGTKYDTAKEDFDAAAGAVSTSERLPLYPNQPNRDGKRKALVEYSESINGLRKLYDPYRITELQNVEPQEFTSKLKAANAEVTKAFESAGSEIPGGFLLGFEKYANEFATKNATGVLQYQLDGLKHALLKLAEARPSEIISVFREELPEENGGKENIASDQVTRNFGYEIAFKGSETAARSFLSALGETQPYYYTVRALKIENERDSPPKVSDAKFEKPKSLESTAPAVDNPFGGAFVLPGDDSEATEAEVEAPTPEAAAPAEEEAAAPEVVEEADSSRILAQVLGSEEVIVFVRFDLTMFLPEKELPKP